MRRSDALDGHRLLPRPHDAATRCRESMLRFERFRSRFALALATVVATGAMVTMICMTAHLLG